MYGKKPKRSRVRSLPQALKPSSLTPVPRLAGAGTVGACMPVLGRQSRFSGVQSILGLLMLHKQRSPCQKLYPRKRIEHLTQHSAKPRGRQRGPSLVFLSDGLLDQQIENGPSDGWTRCKQPVPAGLAPIQYSAQVASATKHT